MCPGASHQIDRHRVGDPTAEHHPIRPRRSGLTKTDRPHTINNGHRQRHRSPRLTRQLILQHPRARRMAIRLNGQRRPIPRHQRHRPRYRHRRLRQRRRRTCRYSHESRSLPTRGLVVEDQTVPNGLRTSSNASGDPAGSRALSCRQPRPRRRSRRWSIAARCRSGTSASNSHLKRTSALRSANPACPQRPLASRAPPG